MNNWKFALKSYGTSADFADHTEFYKILNPDKNAYFLGIFSRNYAGKKDLIEKLRKNEANKNSCFLCDNIEQAKNIGNNLLLPFCTYKNYVLLPNRYPLVNNHSLLINKEHKASLLNEDYLEKIIELSEKYGFLAVRNHPNSGMSIKDHEHIHLTPDKVKLKTGEDVFFNSLAESKLEKTSHDGVFIVKDSPFNILALKVNSKNLFLEVLIKLEAAKEIFTFCYEPSTHFNHKGVFYLAIHKGPDVHGEIKGAANLMHHFHILNNKNMNYEKIVNLLNDHLYKKHEFNWEKYIKP